ncbi:MAG TPA: hypothetical protein VGY58_18130 [Gemmataceae bacterium]|nr:hypothetical protein [Gemmataceae bacterium]
MRCLNCNREISETAKICAHCEASVMEEPTAEEMEAARALLEQLTPEAAAELQQVFLDSDTADEFVDRIFVGNCPKCDSENTGNCENDPEIDNLLVGRCYDCGQLFCTECCRLLDSKALVCDCLDDED